MDSMTVTEATIYVLKYNEHLTKSKLAEMLDITPQAINNYLVNNKSKPVWTVVDKFKEHFDIEVKPIGKKNRKMTNDEIKAIIKKGN